MPSLSPSRAGFPPGIEDFRTRASGVWVSTFGILIFQDQDFRLGGIYTVKISAFGVVIDTEFLEEDFT